MKNKPFSRASLAQRLAALSDGGTWRQLPAHSSLCMVEGQLAGCKVLLVASNPAEALGRFGADECADFRWALQRGRATGVPLLLLLDSAGAQLAGGLQVQGALRALLREMLDARLAELPMLAVLGRYVFGAASLLACAANERVYSRNTLLAMSAPQLLLTLLDNHAAQDRMLNSIKGIARTATGHADRLIADDLDACARAVRGWLARPPAVSVTHASLLQERHHLAQRLPAAAAPAIDGPVLEGDTLLCLLERPFGAADAIALTELAEIACAQASKQPLAIAVRCAGGNIAPLDEELNLAQYLAHMALSLRRLVIAGRPLRLLVKGEVAGGLYLALGAAASTVEITPGAIICSLPLACPSTMSGSPRPESADCVSYVQLGLADMVLEDGLITIV